MPRLSFLLTMILVSLCLGCAEKAATPVAEAPVPTDASQAPAVAVTEVAVPERPANMQEELTRARKYWSPGTTNFIGVLDGVKSGFATLDSLAADEVLPWTKVTLNATGAGIDAVRYEAAPDVVLLLAVAKPRDRNIWLGFRDPQLPHLRGEGKRYSKSNVVIPEIDMPEPLNLVFQSHDGGARRPPTEYFIWFVFEDDQPMDIYVKMRSFDRASAPQKPLATPHEAARLLGMELPFRLAPDATLADRALDVFELHGAEAALEYLDPEISGQGTAGDKLFYARLTQQHATRVVEEQGDRTTVYPRVLKSATLLRELLAENHQLDPQDMQLVPATFYNEACTFALRGQQDDALRSLQEAVQWGFRNVAWIRGDEDLESLHALPGFKQLVDELEKSQS